MKKTKTIAISSVCAALGVVILYLGSLIEVLDFSVAILASMLVLFCVLEFGYGYGAAVYFIISLLSFLLLPNKTPAIFFAGLFGYVPITKFFLEHKLKKWAMLPKLLIFNAVFGFITYLDIKIMGFTMENGLGIPPAVLYIVYFVFINVIYIVCDILFTRLERLYFNRIRDKISKYLK